MNRFKIIFLLGLLIGAYACKKNQVGGRATIKGVIVHHSKPIPNAVVYIKYNAIDFPGDNSALYDSHVTADNNGNYNVSVFKGTYYLYAVGKDLDIPLPNDVKGGLSISIRNNENLVKSIAVTE